MTTQQVDSVQSAWDSIAAGYDEFVTPTHLWLGNEALRLVGLGPGARFLDVAAGSGALSIPAARTGAKVLSTDISPAMVEQLRVRARREGLSNLECRVMDGHSLGLEDDRFDFAGSQFGVMLFPDLPRAVREMRRAVRPGGRVFLVVYGDPGQVEFLTFCLGAIREVVPDFEGLPADPPPLPFQVADPAKLRRELEGAGLEDVRVETTVETLRFRSGQELWDWFVNSNPIAVELTGDLTDGERDRVRDALEDRVRERAGGPGTAVLTNPVHVGIGTK